MTCDLRQINNLKYLFFYVDDSDDNLFITQRKI